MPQLGHSDITIDEGMMMRVRADAERERRNLSNMPLTWFIEALRSGRYVQGRGVLAVKPTAGGDWKYCCLGVACEVYQAHVGGLKVEIIGESEKRYDGCNSHLPKRVEQWLGFTGNSGGGDFVEKLPTPDGRDRRTDLILSLNPEATNTPRHEKTFQNLVDANDDGYFTFLEIADILEAGKVRGTESYAQSA